MGVIHILHEQFRLILISLFQLFSGYYDTTTGPKTEAESYKKIASEIDTEGDLQPDEILFLTDDPKGNTWRILHECPIPMYY